jgi:hypothetical protein
MIRFQRGAGQALITAMLIGIVPAWAAEPAGAAAEPGATTTAAPFGNVSEMEQLKQMLLDQQRQLNELRRQLSQQQLKGAVADQPASAQAATPVNAPAAEAPVSAFPSTGQVASTTAMVPRAAALPALPQAVTAPAKPPTNPCEAPPDTNAVPAYLRLGSVCIVPIGFMDLTAVWRDKDAASGIGSSFGSIPYNNGANAKNSEFRFSPQNSRIGFRIDGDWKGTHFIGYNEFDFLGTSASNNLTVTNGAFVPRIRLFWVDARRGKVEFLAGQSWSMFTPNRTGISAFPGDLFYSQVIDVNYMAGLTWTRQPGVRVLYHPNSKVVFGFSAENPDQYIGGSAGGSGITLPAALTGLSGTQLDAGNIVLSAPTLVPDFIAKLAFDPSSKFHFEVGGLDRTFKIWNPNTGSALGAGQYSTKAAGGILVGLNVEIFKNFRLITTNSWGDGIGRYLFGQAPDLIVRSDGGLSLVHAGGTVDGFEARVMPSLLLYAYYGGIYIGRNTALDANGTSLIGYGYTGSPNSQNRSIQELTFGFNKTMWANPRYGAINAMGQYEYAMREPWFATATQAGGTRTHYNTIYFNLRYTLPGGMPRF